MNGKIIFLILVLLIFSSFPAAGEKYVVFTDREFGFWGVRSYNINHTINYTSRTLNINTGDSIEWMNMDNEDDRITIVSDNLLWEGGKTLGGVGSRFRFTFNSSGTYRFHTVENTRVRLNASNYSENETKTTTITYEDDDGELHTIIVNTGGRNNLNDVVDRNYLNDVVSTEQYYYQQQTIKVTGPTIGNGTYPVKTARQIQSQFAAAIRPVIQVNARPTSTPSESLTQAVAAAAAPKTLESYQEFTIYEVLKRWYAILENG
ncbi:MAG: VCBS domain-containing protein [Candidatus Methanoperedens sp.]